MPDPIYLYRRIVKLLRSNTIQIREVKIRHFGDYDWEGTIGIRKTLISRCKTVIHECLHALYPDATEKWVYEKEREVYAAISKDQVERIIHYAQLITKKDKTHYTYSGGD
jgi:hypothetical protein